MMIEIIIIVTIIIIFVSILPSTFKNYQSAELLKTCRKLLQIFCNLHERVNVIGLYIQHYLQGICVYSNNSFWELIIIISKRKNHLHLANMRNYNKLCFITIQERLS